jgi:hypothetical protein
MKKVPACLAIAAALALGAGAFSVFGTRGVRAAGGEEPTLKLRAPHMTFMRPRMPNEPQRPEVTVRVSAELKGLDKVAPENLEKYYCLEVVWEWDDDTTSEYGPDCDPYKEGADIETHFSGTHQYRFPGAYNVFLRLERNGKVILSGNTRVEIRS